METPATVSTLALAALIAGVPAQAAPRAAADVDVAIDRRVLAVTITMWLAEAESNDWMSGLPDYRAALRAHFGPFRDHRAVQLAGQLARSGFTFDAPVGWALHHDPVSWAPRAELPAYYVERSGSAELLEAYRVAIQRFVAEADLDGFMKAMEPVHHAELARVRRTLAPGAIEELEAFYGAREPASYHVLVVPTLGPHHHGVTVQTADGVERYQVSNTLRWRADAELDLGLENLLLHEFGHSLVRGTMAASRDRLARLEASLMPPIADAMKEQAYPTWSLAMEEHVVRAATCRLVQQRHGEHVARACLAGEVARGFQYVVPLYEAMGSYREQRARYPSLASYARGLVRALEPLARDPSGPAWSELRRWSAGPVQDPLSAVVVLPTGPQATPELQQAARTLAMRRHGHRLITDREALDRPDADYVVVGPPEANLLAARFAPIVPLRRVEDGLQVGAVRLEGDAVGLVAVLPAPAHHTWTWITGTDPAMAMAAIDHVRDRGWAAVSGRGDLCTSGHFPPDAVLAPTPRELSCQPEPVRRPWVPRPLGRTLAWSDSVPPELWPDPFEDAVARSMAECAPAAELVGVDCREPPCIAKLRARSETVASDLVHCEPWEVPYGPTVHMVRANVPCPDGPDERAVLVAPTPAMLQRSLGEERLSDRLSYRWMDLLGEWSCGVGPITVDADPIDAPVR